MALGTAVLTSNTSSLPEVAGDAACMIDPYDTQAMAEAMRVLDTNDAWRLGLEAKGREQAKLFSEEAYAKRLQTLYQTVIDTKRKQAR
jgi:glycosyltransferase involved in cell wall biosynthesis